MSEGVISLDLIGLLLRQIQAEQRTQRAETELIRTEIGQLKAQMAGFVTRELANEIVTLILQRIGNFEALMEARFDQLNARLGRGRSAAP